MVCRVCMCGPELSCVHLFYNPKEYSPPASCVHGIFQTSIPEWVAMPSSRGSSWPGDQTQVSHVSCLARRTLNCWATRKPPYGSLDALNRNTVILFWIYCLQCTWNFKFYHHLNFQVSVLRYHKNTWSSKWLGRDPSKWICEDQEIGPC